MSQDLCALSLALSPSFPSLWLLLSHSKSCRICLKMYRDFSINPNKSPKNKSRYLLYFIGIVLLFLLLHHSKQYKIKMNKYYIFIISFCGRKKGTAFFRYCWSFFYRYLSKASNSLSRTKTKRYIMVWSLHK